MTPLLILTTLTAVAATGAAARLWVTARDLREQLAHTTTDANRYDDEAERLGARLAELDTIATTQETTIASLRDELQDAYTSLDIACRTDENAA